MKRYLPLILALLLSGSVLAQPRSCPESRDGKHNEPPKMEEMVSNLSQMQKRKLETISEESREAVDKKRAELKAVRNSIRQLIDKEGDQSARIFPLMDREAALEAEISKIMYRTRLQIDEVLTKEQIAEFRAKREADRKRHESECREGRQQPPHAPGAAPKAVHRKQAKLPPAKR